MVKLKCPVCGKHIHTLWKRTNCVECHNINIYGTGEVFRTGVDYERHGNSVYVCPHCNYEDSTVDSFFCDDECECGHLKSELISYEGDEIEVCKRCGLILDIDYVGDL